MREAESAGLRLPPGRGPTVVTMGTFDGLHRGHLVVLGEVRRRAAVRGGASVLLTFEPHPLRVVRPAAAPPLLTTAAEKKALLAEIGVDYAVFLAFTPELRECSPRRFVREVLLSRLEMDELVIGHDHGFGRGRSGDADTLRAISAETGFRLSVVDPQETGGQPVSSSSIRRALAEGRLADANHGLGRPYSLEGTVARGDGRGRELGFPTANLRVSGRHKLVPAPGIYACWASLSGPRAEGPPPGPRRCMGALHVGPRPVFPGARDSVEVHLLDFEGDLYGRRLRLDLARRLRPVASFSSAAALASQMGRDVAQTREALQRDAEAQLAGRPRRTSPSRC